MNLLTYLHTEWLTQFSAELIITLLGSFLIINMALRRLELRRALKRIDQSNEVRDNHLQLCSNRLHPQGEVYLLEMINLSSWSLDEVIPDCSLAEHLKEAIHAKRLAVKHNEPSQLYLNETASDLCAQSSLLIPRTQSEAKKISGYLYDLLAARRADLTHYFGEGSELLFSIHYEKVEQGGNQRPRLFVFERAMVEVIAQKQLADPVALRQRVRPMSAEHHLNRLCVMTEQAVRFQAQALDRSLISAVWPYLVPRAHHTHHDWSAL